MDRAVTYAIGPLFTVYLSTRTYLEMIFLKPLEQKVKIDQ